MLVVHPTPTSLEILKIYKVIWPARGILDALYNAIAVSDAPPEVSISQPYTTPTGTRIVTGNIVSWGVLGTKSYIMSSMQPRVLEWLVTWTINV